MKQVYSVYNSAEAHIIKHYLEQNDVVAHIHGESLTGAVGGIAADDHIKIMVADEDVDKARKLIAEWEDAVAPDETAQSAAIAKAKDTTNNIIILLAIGVLIGWFAHSIFVSIGPKFSQRFGEVYESKIDSNRDGKDDYIAIYKDEHSMTPISTKADDNFDGKFDVFSQYDEHGTIISDKMDSNFDGRMDTKRMYHKGLVYKSEKDSSGDGTADELGFYEDGLVVEYHILNPKTLMPKKIISYKNNKPVSALFDADDNGKMDTRYSYDHYEQITKEEKIPEN